MESYMESKLIRLHNAGMKSHFGEKIVIFATGVLVAVLLPYLHIGFFYYIWTPDKPTVDRDHCTCDCFDTVFRGRYEWPPTTYKHVYFNATSGTLAIWLIVVLGIVGLYECLRSVVPLVYYSRSLLRVQMLAVLCSSVYPHYYGWWNLINYINEGFYSQWRHQLFFTLTELISTAMVIHLCCRDSRIEPWKLLIIFNVSLIHITIGCLDQFITNVIYHEGQVFEAVRDLALMAPDVFHMLVAYFELSAFAEKQRTKITKLFYRQELFGSLLIIIMLSLLGKNL